MFEPILQEGNIYLMSNGQVKLANQRFCSIRNDFSIVFDKNASIQEVPNDDSIDNRGYTFVSMQDIINAPRQRVVDFIGVLVKVGQVFDVQLKTGQMKGKR